MSLLIALLLVLGSEPARYSRLREFLELPRIEDEAKGADFVLRALAVPSFHSPCAVSVVRSGDKGEMTVRCADLSDLGRHEESSTPGSLKLIRETFALTADEARSLERFVLGICTYQVRKDDSTDGMTTTFETLVDGKFCTVEVHHDGGVPDACMKAIGALIAKHGTSTPRFAASWQRYL